jgi:hypothetical protein
MTQSKDVFCRPSAKCGPLSPVSDEAYISGKAPTIQHSGISVANPAAV